MYRQDILDHAYQLVQANKGASGVGGVAFDSLEEREGGTKRYLEEIGEELRGKVYMTGLASGFTSALPAGVDSCFVSSALPLITWLLTPRAMEAGK